MRYFTSWLPSSDTIIHGLQNILAFSILIAWGWLILRGYGDPTPFTFNDEAGSLFAMLPSTIFFLLIFAWRDAFFCKNLRLMLPLVILTLCAPSLFNFLQPLNLLVAIFAGFGFAGALLFLSISMAAYNRARLIIIASGCIIGSALSIELILLLGAPTLLPIVLALLFKIFLPLKTTQEIDTANASLDRVLLLNFAIIGFSYGLYYCLMGILEPLPHASLKTFLFVALGTAFCAVTVKLGRRGTIWHIALLTGPLVLLGYTACP